MQTVVYDSFMSCNRILLAVNGTCGIKRFKGNNIAIAILLVS